jgi:hypothetical protein
MNEHIYKWINKRGQREKGERVIEKEEECAKIRGLRDERWEEAVRIGRELLKETRKRVSETLKPVLLTDPLV